MAELYIPDINYEDWLEVSKNNSKNPNNGTFKASKTTSKRNAPIKSEDPLYRLLSSDQGLQKATMESILNAAKKFATRLSDLQGKGSFLKKEADNGPKKEYNDDQLYFSIFLMIQMWGGQTGRGALTSYPGKGKDWDIIRKAQEDGLIPDPNVRSTYVGGGEGYNKWKENPGNANKGEKPLVAVEYSKYWLPNYKKAVELTKEGKFGEALQKFSKIPQVDISFGSKHLWFWGQVFNSIKKYNKVPHVYDTRIARMLFGIPAKAENYDDADKAYETIIKQKGLSNFSSSDVEQALFAFSNSFFDNDLEKWEYEPENKSADEESVKEAKNIFCIRNSDKCEKEGDSWKLLPSATSSNTKNNKSSGEDKSINGVGVNQMITAANSLSKDSSEENKIKYKKIYDKLSSYDINDLPDTSNRKGWIKTIQDAYKETPEKLPTDNKEEEEEANKAKIDRIKGFPENEEMLKAYVELAGKEPDNGVELSDFGDQYARIKDDREMARFKNAWKNHFKEKEQKELEKLKKDNPDWYDEYVDNYGEPKSAEEFKKFLGESKLNKWAKWATR